jgi:hypothetical protein
MAASQLSLPAQLAVVQAMAETGIDISREFPKQLTNDKVEARLPPAPRHVRGDVLLYCRHPHGSHALPGSRRAREPGSVRRSRRWTKNALVTWVAPAYALRVTIRRYACLAISNRAVSAAEIAAIARIERERSRQPGSRGEPVTSH